MTADAIAKQQRPQLVAAQPEIGWTPADRIAPGEYPAYSRSMRVYRDPHFKRWVCAVQFDVLDETLMKRLARVTWFLNLGDHEKPHAGRRTLYWSAWLAASGRPPVRGDRLSPRIFVKRHARIAVGNTSKNFRQQRVGDAAVYSVVRGVVRWETGHSADQTINLSTYQEAYEPTPSELTRYGQPLSERLPVGVERLGKDSARAGVESKQTNPAQGADETSQDFSSAKGSIANRSNQAVSDPCEEKHTQVSNCGDHESQFPTTVASLADEAAIAKARARGEMHGFSGIFLANFIERELQLMVKWRNHAKSKRTR